MWARIVLCVLGLSSVIGFRADKDRLGDTNDPEYVYSVWAKYKHMYNKRYSSLEDKYRWVDYRCFVFTSDP